MAINCAGITPLLKQNFLGATVVSFSSNIGWGISTGSMQVTVVEDAGQTFNPPPIGQGVSFSFAGFKYFGLLQAWEESLSMQGKTYTVTIQTPHQVLSGTQVILRGVDDFDIASLGSNKFINLHLETAPRPFQGNTYFSYCNEVGATWKDLRDIIDITSAGGGAWAFIHRGNTFYVDCGVLAGADNFRIGAGGSTIDVLTAIDKVAKILQKRIYLDLIRVPLFPGTFVIKVRAHDTSVSAINANLMNTPSIGDIGTRLQQSTGYHLMGVGRSLRPGNCTLGGGLNKFAPPGGSIGGYLQSVINQRYGIEASEVLSDILITGDNIHWLFEVIDEGGTDDDNPPNDVSIEPNENQLITVDDDGNDITNQGAIRHYWGSEVDQNGNEVPIVSTGTGDTENFFVDVSAQTWFRAAQPALPGQGQYYNISVLEIRAAANSFESWYEFMACFKPELLRRFFRSDPNVNLNMFTPQAVWELIRDFPRNNDGTPRTGEGAEVHDAQETNRAMTEAYETMMRNRQNAVGTDGLRSMHSFVSKFKEHYGRKFFVPIPPGLVSCCSGGANVELVQGLERAEFGWAVKDGSGAGYRPVDTVLGLKWDSVILEMFKSDEGGVGGILYYEKVRFEPESGDFAESLEQSYHVGIDFAQIPQAHPYYAEPTTVTVPGTGQIDEDDGVEPSKTDTGFRVWLGAKVSKIHDPCNIIGNGPGAVVETPNPLHLRASVIDAQTGNPHGLRFALWQILIAEQIRLDADENGPRPLTDDERAILQEYLFGRPGGSSMQGIGLIPKAHMPSAAVVPFKDNKRTYPGANKWWNQAVSPNTGLPVHANAEYRKDDSLTPWNFGGLDQMNEGGEIQVATATSTQDIVEQGSFAFTGVPLNIGLQYMGQVIGGGDPRTSGNLTSLSCQVGVGGIQTTVQFRTFVPNWGEWGEQRTEYVAALGRNQLNFERSSNLNEARRIQQQIRQLFIDSGINTGIDSETAGPTGNLPGGMGWNSESDFIFGFSSATAEEGDGGDGLSAASTGSTDTSQSTYVAMTTLRTALGLMSVNIDGEYRIRAGMSLDGLLRPYEVVDSWNSDTEQNTVMSKYRINEDTYKHGMIVDSSLDTTGEQHENYGINSDDLLPFKDDHDIKRAVYGDTYPSDGIELRGNNHGGLPNLRPWGLKGPMILTGWGLDVDGYPVPNDGVGTTWDRDDRTGDYIDNHMKKQNEWKTGPIDLRWDETRSVWTSKPANKLKIVQFQLLSEFEGSAASAKILSSADTNAITQGDLSNGEYNKLTAMGSNDYAADDFDPQNFTVHDKNGFFESAEVGDKGIAVRDYDSIGHIDVIYMAPETTDPPGGGGASCDINVTTKRITNAADPCYNTALPVDGQLIKYGQECFPCTLEQTYKVTGVGATKMKARGYCPTISKNAVNDFDFDPNAKQFLGHTDGNFEDESRSGSDKPCIKWMSANTCEINEQSEEGGNFGQYGQGESGSEQRVGHMACTLENTYNYWDFARVPSISTEFNFSENSKNDHGFHPYRNQVLVHENISRYKRETLGAGFKEVPRVYWSSEFCDIPKSTVAGKFTESDKRPIELGQNRFPCDLEQTYKWTLTGGRPEGSNSNTAEEEQFSLLNDINVSKDDVSVDKIGAFEISHRANRDFEFNPIWRQNLIHTHYEFNKNDVNSPGSQPDEGQTPQVKWAPSWYASIPFFTIKIDETPEDLIERYYSGHTTIPSIRPDYNLTKDADKYRFGQNAFPMMLADTYGHSENNIAEQSTYLGESNKEWGFSTTLDNTYKFNFNPNKRQVLGHMAAGTKDRDEDDNKLLTGGDKKTPANAADQKKSQAAGDWWMDVDVNDCAVPKGERGFFPCALSDTYLGAPISWPDDGEEDNLDATGKKPEVDMGWESDKQQKLVHLSEKDKDGNDQTPAIAWVDDSGDCDINDTTGEVTPDSGDPFIRYGKDAFPCTLEETYQLGFVQGNEACKLTDGISSNVSDKATNDFNFNVEQIQFLGHLAHVPGDKTFTGSPQVRWQRAEYPRIHDNDGTGGETFTENGAYGRKHFPNYLHELYGGASGTDKPSVRYKTASNTADGEGDGDVCKDPGLEDFGWKKDETQVLGHLKTGADDPGVSSPAGKVRWLKYSGCSLPSRVSQLLPCRLEDTLRGASKNGSLNTDTNAADLDYQDYEFGFNIEEDQYLAHFKDDNQESGGITTAKIRWHPIGAGCSIPATPTETSTDGRIFGRGVFPCSIEEIFGFTEGSTVAGQSSMYRKYEDGQIVHSFDPALNGKMNDFGFNPNISQYLAHEKAGGDTGDDATKGPNVKWMPTCCVKPDSQDLYPCKLEDTYKNKEYIFETACGPPETDFGFNENMEQRLIHFATTGGKTTGVYWINDDKISEDSQVKFPARLEDTYSGSGANFVGRYSGDSYKGSYNYDPAKKQVLAHLDGANEKIEWIEIDSEEDGQGGQVIVIPGGGGTPATCKLDPGQENEWPCHIWETYKNLATGQFAYDFNGDIDYDQHLMHDAYGGVTWKTTLGRPWNSEQPSFLWQTMEGLRPESAEWNNDADFHKETKAYSNCGFDENKTQVLGHAKDSNGDVRIVWIDVEDCEN